MKKGKTEFIYEIGKSCSRYDAVSKVTGRERYAADYYSKDMLWAGVKRAGVSHAKIRDIDISKALSLNGVIKILTFKDIKGNNRVGVVKRDQPVLVEDKIRHFGDAIALIIAEGRDILKEAINLIEIRYDPLPPVFDPLEALKQGAPLIHEDNPDGNILLKGEIRKGRGEDAFRDCDEIVEANFSFAHQEHAYLETECGFAIYHEDSQILEIVASTQSPFRDRFEVAEALGIELDRVRIIAPYCGGAFGGKDGITVQCLLGLAAINCPNRPIKMWWDREESIISGVKRHPAKLHYRLGAKSDGIFHALNVDIYYDTGPYDHLGGAVMALGLEHSGGPYRIPHTHLRAWAVYTNSPVGGAFRGFGVPQVMGAMEQVVDMMADRLGICPLEIRLKNALIGGDENPVGMKLTTSTGLRECLESLKNHPWWKERKRWKSKAGRFKLRGIGVSSVFHAMGYGPVIPDSAEAKIELTDDGKIRVYAGVVDMGQGNASTYLQIAGSILNQTPKQMELVLPDTKRCLPSGSSSASRTTYTYGNALIRATLKLKEKILRRALDMLKSQDIEAIEILPGKIRDRDRGKEVSLRDISILMEEDERTERYLFKAPVCEEKVIEDERLSLHGIPHLIFSYGVHLAYVEIDRLTGEVEIKRYLTISDCGKILNPQLFEQQMHGGIAQGIGYALYEDFSVEQGRIKTDDLTTYIIPGAKEIPDMESIAIELSEDTGPFGLKGSGEIAMNGPLPAISNAIADACGARIFSSPITAEKVLRALERREGER